MSVKYHISKATGRSNICRANTRACPVGGQHFDTKAEANTFIQKELKNEHGEIATIKKGREKAAAERRKVNAEWAMNLNKEKRAIANAKLDLIAKTPGMFDAENSDAKIVYDKHKAFHSFPNNAKIRVNYHSHEVIADSIELSNLTRKVRTEDYLRDPEDQKRFSELYAKSFPEANSQQIDKITKVFSSKLAVGDPTYIFRSNHIHKMNNIANDKINNFELGGTEKFNKAEEGYRAENEKAEALKAQMKTEYAESTVIRYSDVGKGFRDTVGKIFRGLKDLSPVKRRPINR